MIYPAKISERLSVLDPSKSIPGIGAAGVVVSFCCGSFVRFFVDIEAGSSIVRDVGFKSNGCGFMLAAADVLAEWLSARDLTEIGGLSDDDLMGEVDSHLGEIPTDRRDCVDSCIQSIRSSLKDLRSQRIVEYSGEKALICTCFGVTEERIEAIIQAGNIESVDDVSDVCNAGRGCGSCRMMIEEMIDNA